MSKRKKRTAHRLGGMEQRVLLPVEPEPTASEETKPGAAQEHHFHVGKRDKLFVAEERLSTYLERNGNGWVLRLEEAIRKLDLTFLLAGYSTQGRIRGWCWDSSCLDSSCSRRHFGPWRDPSQ